DRKPADARPPGNPALEPKWPLAATARSDMNHLLLGDSAVITVAVKNIARAPEVTRPGVAGAAQDPAAVGKNIAKGLEVTMPVLRRGSLQFLSGPELRPTILDAVEPQDWPYYRNNNKVPGLRIIEAMRNLHTSIPAEMREAPKVKEVEPPKGLAEARANFGDLWRDDWVFKYTVTPGEVGPFYVDSFTVTAPNGQVVKTNP